MIHLLFLFHINNQFHHFIFIFCYITYYKLYHHIKLSVTFTLNKYHLKSINK